MRLLAAPLVPLLLTLSGCPLPRVVGVDEGDGYAPVRISENQDVDVLFVVDNGPTMAAKISRLRSAARAKLPMLATRGVVRFGAISSDLGAGSLPQLGCLPGGDAARLLAVGPAAPATCTPPTDGRAFWEIDSVAGTSNVAQGSTLGDALDCLLAFDSSGCVVQQPFAAAARALDGKAGFARPDAVLLLLFVTDGDDCSLPASTDLFEPGTEALYGPLDEFRCVRFGVTWGNPPRAIPDGRTDALPIGPLPSPAPSAGRLVDTREMMNLLTLPGGLRTDPNDVVALSLSGPDDLVELIGARAGTERTATQIPCAPIDGDQCREQVRHACAPASEPALFGDPAVRLRSVIQSVTHGYAGSICDDDHADSLGDAVGMVRSRQQGPGCLSSRLVDPRNPACVVEDQVDLGAGDITHYPIPRCDPMPAPPCWRVVPDRTCAPIPDTSGESPDRYRLVIDRGNTSPPPGGTPKARCAVQ